MGHRADPHALARLRDAGHHPELAGRVLRVVEQFRAGEAVSLCGAPDDTARATLADVVHAGLPDVALRLFLTMAVTHLMPLNASLFDELTDLANQVGLDSDVVAGLRFLLRPD